MAWLPGRKLLPSAINESNNSKNERDATENDMIILVLLAIPSEQIGVKSKSFDPHPIPASSCDNERQTAPAWGNYTPRFEM